MDDRLKRLVEEVEVLNRLHKARIDESRRRLDAAIGFEETSNVPVQVWVEGMSGWYLRGRYGLNMAEYFRNIELQALYQLKERADAFREIGDDRLEMSTTVGVEGGVVSHPSVLGCRIVYPEDDWPWVDVSYHPLDTAEKIDDFQVPEIAEVGIMPEIIERYEAMRKFVGNLAEVTVNPGDGVPERPLQMAVYARGYNNLVRDMHTDPKLTCKLLGKMVEVGEAIHDFYGELLGSGPLQDGAVDLYDNFLGHFSPSIIREFILPHYREWAQKYGWKSWTLSSQCVLDPYVEIMAEVPTERITYLTSSSNIKLFKETFTPKRVWVKVAYESSLMLNNAPQIVEEECERIIETMSPGGGFIMGTACLDWRTPEQNIRALIRATRKGRRV